MQPHHEAVILEGDSPDRTGEPVEDVQRLEVVDVEDPEGKKSGGSPIRLAADQNYSTTVE